MKKVIDILRYARQIVFTIYSLVVFVVLMMLLVQPVIALCFIFGKTTEKKRLNYHRSIQKMAIIAQRMLPGVRFHLSHGDNHHRHHHHPLPPLLGRAQTQAGRDEDSRTREHALQHGGGTTTYTYTLKYRVRLENERNSFVEGTIYPTNDTTTLQYRTVEGTDGNLTVSDPKTVKFPIPSVHGYLAELTFTKQDNRGNPLSGAEFTLQHDAQQCSICRGDGTAVKITDQTATSVWDLNASRCSNGE